MRPVALALFVVALASCKSESKHEGAPPPPAPSAPAPGQPSTDRCAAGGGVLVDAALAPLFPRARGGYCLGEASDLKTYGKEGKLGIKQLCETALDGGCEEYMRFGVTRAAIFHYAQGVGGGSVEVIASQFPGDAALSLFTTRLVGDLDPVDPSMPRPIAGVASGSLGTGKAYVVRGSYFVELTYSNELETPEQLAQSSAAALTALAQDIWAKLPDKPATPAVIGALPEADRIPLGLLYVTNDFLAVPGLGAGAVGFYKKGDARWRTAVVASTDAEQAKRAMQTLAKRPGALPVAAVGDEAVQVVLAANAERPKIEFIFARKGASVFGIGDDEFVPGVKAGKEDKLARLRPLIAPAAK
jgi:hypothetical protein